jgi:methyl-accepting chemotaxis protein-1 (serine sensor receptor)
LKDCNMNIKQQIIGFGLAAAVLVGIAGAIGVNASARMGNAITVAMQANDAKSAGQTADMMHDAIRGDAQRALLGALQWDNHMIAAAKADLQDHAQTMRSELARMGELPIGNAGQQALAAALPVVEDYIQTAERMVAGAASTAAEAQAEDTALQQAFDALEVQLEALADVVGQEAQTHADGAQAGVQTTEWLILASTVTSLVCLVLGAAWLSGRLTRPISRAVASAERLAQGDLTQAIEVSGTDETRQLLLSLANMQERMVAMVRDVKNNADQVATASAQIAHGNQDLSSRTEQQASALQQTAATMEELGTTVRNNADSAVQANSLAVGAAQVASQGGEVMARVVDTMGQINDSSRRIADIIGTIDSIAFQTNILALNAAVEAARAGEQGRGFAVVASEVRSLAQRSAEAAREIKTLVGTSVDRVEAGTSLVGQAGETMKEIVGAIQRVNAIVSEISASSREQSNGVSQVGDAVTQMDRSTQQSAALVEETAAAAESLSGQARQLVTAVGAFRV